MLNTSSSSDPVGEVSWSCDGQLTENGLAPPGSECQKHCLSGEFWSGNKSTKRCDCKKTCVWKLQTSTCKPAKTTCDINAWMFHVMKGSNSKTMPEGLGDKMTNKHRFLLFFRSKICESLTPHKRFFLYRPDKRGKKTGNRR